MTGIQTQAGGRSAPDARPTPPVKGYPHVPLLGKDRKLLLRERKFEATVTMLGYSRADNRQPRRRARAVLWRSDHRHLPETPSDPATTRGLTYATVSGEVMKKTRAAVLFGSLVALAACADSPTKRSITAPRVEPSLDVSTGGAGPVIPFGGGEPLAHVPRAGNERAATGGFAMGRFELAAPFFPIQAEQYSFNALSVGTFPNAKGQLEGKIARLTNFQDIHIKVDCLVINGNEAWMSGPITRLVVNGVAEDPRGRQVAWRVQDNGEGSNSPPDMGTVMFVGFPQACLVYFLFEDLPLVPDANGDIQVSQK